MTIQLDRRAQKSLARLPGVKQRNQIRRRIEVLGCGFGDCRLKVKAMRGLPGILLLACGEFRIVFTVDGSCIVVLDIGKRNDSEVYKAVLRRRRLPQQPRLGACNHGGERNDD
jgi:mRNA-degrading endonuclease RelE of RelBE toxin-antitoxin system